MDEARDLFRDMRGTSLTPETPFTRRVFVDPDGGISTSVEGMMVSGFSLFCDPNKIVQILADAGIAGYSRATQVSFGRSEAEQITHVATEAKTQVYKPKVEFYEDGLYIGFDETLKVPSDKLNETDDPVTWFLIHPERALYIGLQFIPKDVLRKVVAGLKTYKNYETFTKGQQDLISLAITRLENLLTPQN